ncbi:unnamed protein product [Rhizophagus irregularis]|uniref:RNA-directed DNA polymerase from mobile element jockey-like n=1 Tax=Rhizophagus irregularis TaxID=588596 RepID=A0A915Z8H4_9GLOM|nr:unnamed protein product [Rhizophagus irregularis]CAB5364646.1 unnamed protein product [Rhizophagus irregularis]
MVKSLILLIKYKRSYLLTNPEKEVINHFQNVTSSLNQDKILTGKWVKQYMPKDYINSNIYDGLMDEITQEVVDYHISLLTNGKVSGPSKMSYEMLKHGLEMKQFIRNFLNECLSLKKIPMEWKLPALYPIPKHKTWCCKLVNTRPTQYM